MGLRSPRLARAGRGVCLGAAVLLVLLATPRQADAYAVNLDRDPAAEQLVQVRVTLPYFPMTILGRQWAVVDRVDGRRITRVIGPPGERLRRPRLGDRNGDGRIDLFLQAQAGNSLFFGEVAEWDGRRARRLWRLDVRPLLRAIGPGLAINVPTFTRFPDEDDDGVRDIEVGAGVGECRACPQDEYRLRYRWSPERHRWVLLSIRP